MSRRLLVGTAAALAASVLACLFLASLWIDRSISLSHMESSHRSTAQARDQLAALLAREWAGRSEAEVFARLQAASNAGPGAPTVLKREPSENAIWFGDIRFQFEAGKLRDVR